MIDLRETDLSQVSPHIVRKFDFLAETTSGHPLSVTECRLLYRVVRLAEKKGISPLEAADEISQLRAQEVRRLVKNSKYCQEQQAISHHPA